MRPCLLLAILPVLTLGCSSGSPKLVHLNFSRYHLPGYPWRQVSRVLLMPLVNESDQTRAAAEMGEALAAELQRFGLFEVVVAPAEPYAVLSGKIRQTGRFNEAELVELARKHRADIVLLGAVTRYRPFMRPHIGLTIQAVSPDEGAIAGSVDGLWDATYPDIASRARRYYARKHHVTEEICNYFGFPDTDYAHEVVLDSPHLFRRFVAFEAGLALFLNLIPKGKEPTDWPAILPPNPGPFRPGSTFGALPWKKKQADCPPEEKEDSKSGKKEKGKETADKKEAAKSKDDRTTPKAPAQPEQAPPPRKMPPAEGASSNRLGTASNGYPPRKW